MILAGLVLAVALETPEILALRCDQTSSGVVIKLMATAPLQGVTTERSGTELVISFQATLPEPGLALPRPFPPVASFSIEQDDLKARLRVTVAPGTNLVSRAEGSLLSLEFRAPASAESTGPRDVEHLFPLLFPGQARTSEPTSAAPAEVGGGPSSGFQIGPFAVKPALVLRYIDADSTFLGTAQPVRARYLEVQPSLAATTDRGFFGGRLNAGYEPRLRTTVDRVPALGNASHFASVGFDVPLGAWLWFTASDQFARGSIETQVVDPGREYFFDIGRFKRNQVSLGLRSETESRVDFEVGAAFVKETLAPRTGYFDNDRRTAHAAVRYELTPIATLALAYEYERVPPPAVRALVESTAHTLSVKFEGEVSPLLKADAFVGYRRQDNPLAPTPGNRYRGITFGANLRRELPSGAEVKLGASRSTQLSAFESNAFYVATGVQAGGRVPLPWTVELSGSASYQWNAYDLVARSLSETRSDKLFGWTLGLARPLTRWSYLRADYARDRRRSNVPGLSTRTHAFILQLGLGLAGGR